MDRQRDASWVLRDNGQPRPCPAADASSRGALALDVLLDAIALEVRRPLATIVTSSETSMRWLARPDPAVRRASQLSATIHRAALQAMGMIERYRALASSLGGGVGPFDLNAQVRRAVTALSERAQAANVEIVVHAADALPLLHGYSEQFAILVSALLANGIEASPGGRIVVTTGVANGVVAWEVCDDGPGFGGHHDFAFDGLYTTKAGHLGMGLTLCRMILSIHGGTIAAGDAAEGGGWVRCTIDTNREGAGDVG